MDWDSKTVLIVEDDAGVSRALSRAIRSLGYQVCAFESGEALLAHEVLESSAMLLLDLHLPGIGGAELIAALVANAPNLRIVVMTGRDIGGAREACFEAGAASYITKPISRAELLSLFEVGRNERCRDVST